MANMKLYEYPNLLRCPINSYLCAKIPNLSAINDQNCPQLTPVMRAKNNKIVRVNHRKDAKSQHCLWLATEPYHKW